ncbi:MAG: cytochrome c [Saprospiraceae bacterium]
MKIVTIVMMLFVANLMLYFYSCYDSPYMQGKRLYVSHCQSCHMADGSGLEKLIPAIQTSKYLGSSAMACVLKQGIRDSIFSDSSFLVKEMPSFSNLSTTEVTNIINFVNHAWYPQFKEMTILEIEATLQGCEE